MQTGHRKSELDGLRALAICPVLVGHAWPELLRGGYLGVDIFFVLSGYLITGIILAEIKSSTFSFIQFYKRRALRLLPAFFFVLFATFMASWLVHAPDETSLTLMTGFYAAFGLSNLFLPTTGGYFDAVSTLNPLLHSWSLGVEEQFYLAFPLVLFAAMRWAPRALALVLLSILTLSLARALQLHGSGSSFAYYDTFARAWELMLGALLSVAMRHAQRGEEAKALAIMIEAFGWISLASIALALTGGLENQKLLSQGLICGGTAGLILACIRGTGLLAWLLRLRPLVVAGLLSYSLYLWHQPVMAFARLFHPDGNAVFAVGTIAVSVLMAALTYRLIEMPARHLDIRFCWIPISLGGAWLVVLVVFGTVVHSAGWAGRYEGSKVLATVGIPDEHKALECGLLGPLDPKVIEFCLFPAGSSADKVVPGIAIWGDSHAMALSSGFISLDRPYDVLHLGMNGCAMLSGEGWKLPGEDCQAKHRAALRRILDDDSIRIIVLHSRWMIPDRGGAFEQNMRETLASTMQQLKDAGREVILVTPVPTYGVSVPNSILRRERIGIGPVPEKALEAHLADPTTMRRGAVDAASRSGATVVHSEDVFCPNFLCVSHIEGKPLYVDDDHLSAFGAGLLAQHVDGVTRLFLDTVHDESKEARPK